MRSAATTSARSHPPFSDCWGMRIIRRAEFSCLEDVIGVQKRECTRGRVASRETHDFVICERPGCEEV